MLKYLEKLFTWGEKLGIIEWDDPELKRLFANDALTSTQLRQLTAFAQNQLAIFNDPKNAHVFNEYPLL